MGVDINAFFSKNIAPDVRLGYNTILLLDQLSGKWVKGTRGNRILIGGHTANDGIAAKTNCGKSQLGLHKFCTVLNRYPLSTGMLYESEGTMDVGRPNKVSASMAWEIGSNFFRIPTPEEVEEALLNDGVLEDRIAFIDGNSLYFDKFIDMITEIAAQREKDRKVAKNLVTLPFRYSRIYGDKSLRPHFVFTDSGTEADVNSAQTKSEKEGIDSSKDNLYFGRDGLIKTKIFARLNGISTKADIMFLTTAAVDKKWGGETMGQHPEKVMSYLPSGDEIKGVGTSFKKITLNLWTFGRPTVFTKGTATSDKFPKYPENTEDNYLGNTDLEQVMLLNLRGKAGPSGMPFPLIRSQRSGILPECCEFEALRKWGRDDKNADYGITVPSQYHFSLAFNPEVKFRNTNFREVINGNYSNRIALQLLFSMKMFLHILPTAESERLMCTPEELYNDIKALGYNWLELLDTRYWWTHIESEDQFRPQLTIYDLLLMRKGEYHPYWMKNKPTPVKA